MSMAQPRVSIIIRTKDRPHLLARALDDILMQTIADWEAVVVNDGGSPAPVDDLVAARADDFAGRCRVIHHEHSLGMEGASNRGVQATTGAYIAIHDDDDTWRPDFLEATTGALDADEALVGVAVPTEVIMERVVGGHIEEFDRWMFTPPGDVVTVFDLILSNRVVPIGLLVRRRALEEIGGFDEALPVVGDWEFNLRLALAGPIAYLAGDPLAYWHQRPDHRDGSLANSVHGATDLHFRYDRIVRDRALREDLSSHGLGSLLYLSKFLDERLHEMEERMRARQDEVAAASSRQFEALRREMRDAIHREAQYYSVGATVKRCLRRLLRRG
ncbi:glycosyltransferase family 2 protein [Microbacterium sp. zg.Y909]|uniref:glycosyltransferase family 2 protein n=1 Tax=Microbacterium sp. zg.Y909 TaxID=2969413 RepID=UPI00214B6C67|nr:glycosyltransferase family 2 protein [Microbacterium sp. zg.Y909]MCR2824014.1 glycosyltransferase [Microbacterium sp. zg.Y909]